MTDSQSASSVPSPDDEVSADVAGSDQTQSGHAEEELETPGGSAGEASMSRADEVPEDAGALEEAASGESSSEGAEEDSEESDIAEGAGGALTEATSEEAEVAPAGPVSETPEEEEEVELHWYILKVQVNREDSIRTALERRIKVAGLEDCFDEIIVPTEDVVEFTKSGKKRLVKRKLFPGYLLIRMRMTDDAWFLVRETPGVGDFTGTAYGSRPSPMDEAEVERILHASVDAETGETQVKTAIPFKPGDRVRVKEGYFENFEGEVESIDEANGRITVIISIFGRSTPVELEHWQVESL